MLTLPSVRAAIESEWDVGPAIPSEWNAEEAWAVVVRLSRLSLARHCPVSRAPPRKEWVTEQACLAIQRHSEARREYFQGVEASRFCKKLLVFNQWRLLVSQPALRLPFRLPSSRGHGPFVAAITRWA